MMYLSHDKIDSVQSLKGLKMEIGIMPMVSITRK